MLCPKALKTRRIDTENMIATYFIFNLLLNGAGRGRLTLSSPDRLGHFDQHAPKWLSQILRNACVYLYGNRNFLFRKVHHIGHIAGEESAMPVGDADLRRAYDYTQTIFGIAPKFCRNAIEHHRD